MGQYEFTNHYTRSGEDFYIDPPFCSEKLFEKVRFEGKIHDPACGTGTIVKSAWKAGYAATAADKTDRGFLTQHVKDYLTDLEVYDNIITNPPYNLVEAFAQHALELTSNKVAILARLAFLEGQRRFHTLFSKLPPSLVLVFSSRPSMPPPGVQAGGGKTAYCWLIWDHHRRGFKPRLDWIINEK